MLTAPAFFQGFSYPHSIKLSDLVISEHSRPSSQGRIFDLGDFLVSVLQQTWCRCFYRVKVCHVFHRPSTWKYSYLELHEKSCPTIELITTSVSYCSLAVLEGKHFKKKLNNVKQVIHLTPFESELFRGHG